VIRPSTSSLGCSWLNLLLQVRLLLLLILCCRGALLACAESHSC
jgi:hypothetical protein